MAKKASGGEGAKAGVEIHTSNPEDESGLKMAATVTLKPHPLSKSTLRPLNRHEWGSLVDSLQGIGVQVALHVEREGDTLWVLDGCHRLRACRKLGISPVPIKEVGPFDSHEGRLAFIRQLNQARRSITVMERRAAAEKLLRMYPERSDGWIGRDSGFDKGSVAKLRTGLEAKKRIPSLDYRVGLDGKKYPVERTPTVIDDEVTRRPSEPESPVNTPITDDAEEEDFRWSELGFGWLVRSHREFTDHIIRVERQRLEDDSLETAILDAVVAWAKQEMMREAEDEDGK